MSYVVDTFNEFTINTIFSSDNVNLLKTLLFTSIISYKKTLDGNGNNLLHLAAQYNAVNCFRYIYLTNDGRELFLSFSHHGCGKTIIIPTENIIHETCFLIACRYKALDVLKFLFSEVKENKYWVYNELTKSILSGYSEACYFLGSYGIIRGLDLVKISLQMDDFILNLKLEPRYYDPFISGKKYHHNNMIRAIKSYILGLKTRSEKIQITLANWTRSSDLRRIIVSYSIGDDLGFLIGELEKIIEKDPEPKN